MGKKKDEKPKRHKGKGKKVGGKRYKSFIESNRSLVGQKEMHNDLKLVGSNIFSRLSFWSAQSLIWTGFRRTLVHNDLWQLPQNMRSYDLWEKFEPLWNEEKKLEKPSLFRAVRKLFFAKWILALFLQFLYGCLSFANPIILPFLLKWLADPTQPYYLGLIYLAIIFVCSIVGSFLYYASVFISSTLGIQVRSVLVQAVYRKVLSIRASKTSSSGNIVNLVANDTQFLTDTLTAFNNGITAPFQIIIATGLLGRVIGAYCLIAPLVFFIMLPVASILGKRFGAFRQLIQIAADRRLKLTNELINGIRIVKFYAWEDAFVRNINSARQDELKQVRGLGYNRSFLIFIMSNTTTIIVGLIFLFFGFFGSNGNLEVGTAFSTLSFINLLKLPFFLLPFTITLILQYKVTFDRIQQFISAPDITKEEVQQEAEKAEARVKKADFSWDPKAETPTLTNVDVKLKPGSLTMVVGAVGSGKSTLAMALLGEVSMTKGKRSLTGSVAYVSQEAWIINASVKENILFGEKWDKKKYERVIQASALGPDLDQLPGGDATEIGERGINLSGGQKQRISIARALYSDKQFYIMDDPLSAVDSHVGKHLFEKGIKGYLKGRTILLVTNQLQYLPEADNLIVLAGGQQVDFGPFKTLMERCVELQNIMKEFGEIEEKKDDKKEKGKEEANTKPITKKKSKKLTSAEEKASGLVGFGIYWYYIVGGGRGLFFIITLVYLLSTACSIGSAWWLAVWSSSAQTGGAFGRTDQAFFIGIYIAWIVAIALFNYIGYILFVPFSTNASNFLHFTLLSRIARAPTSFFDTTPVGRILNRFAKELSLVDALLPIQLSQYINAIFSLFAIFAALLFGSPFVAIAIVPMLIFYIWFQYFYRKTSVELQRLEAVSRAPILSHLSETLNGVESIRAYNMQETFKNMNGYKIDFNATELYSLRYCAAWFGLRLDWVGNLLVLATLLAIVLTKIFSAPGSLNVGFAGIAITYLGGMTLVLSQLNLNAVETEMRMNSVERIKEYETLPQEAEARILDKTPPPEWPSKGVITFKSYSMAYREGDKVLDSIELKIKGQEKVGIVGRTGAGKSSLMQALFRMVEPSEGTIEIDGIDITSIGLADLRSRLAIIPQEPVLFIGTLRYNLDPFEEHEEKDIWEALRLVHLKKVVTALPGKLDEPVAEHGSNFSVGQRQLICMARALLRKTKILLMDEATASVDQLTDSLIQKMVRKNFKDRTVLTIAHRLNTIMDSTKVMVLDKGKLAEYDSPKGLLNVPNGYFTSMVDAVGPTMAQYLRKIAFGEIDIAKVLRESIDKERESISSRSDVDSLSSDEEDSDEKKKKVNKDDSEESSSSDSEADKKKQKKKEKKKKESSSEAESSEKDSKSESSDTSAASSNE